ncbi:MULTISPECIES: hypothetical protein [unclassified Microcoleus]|uniref:hypothetical protein n=1 Tax=unclassified Microcoleus TaxID=2642155 RepID=UPI002FD43806
MKNPVLLALPATALLLGLSNLTFGDRTTVSFNILLAQSQPAPDRDRRLGPHPPRIDFAAAAKQLGTTEAKLIEVLGLPAKPPEPPTASNSPPCLPPPPPLDIRGAAKKLGVTEARLIQILGIPPRPPGDRNIPPNSEKR